jgi:hypothetical protein
MDGSPDEAAAITRSPGHLGLLSEADATRLKCSLTEPGRDGRRHEE